MKHPSKNAATIYLSKWPPSSDTHKTMKRVLDQIARVSGSTDALSHPWHELRYETVRAIPAQLRGVPLAPRTVNLALSALRGVLEAAWRLGQIPDEAYRQIEIKNVRGKSLPAGRALSDAEVDAVIAGLDKVPARDGALVAVLAACGLRRVELVRLQKEAYDTKRGRLAARGKGDKERVIPVAPRWQPTIAAWFAALDARALAFPLTRRQVSYTIETFCATTGIARFTPHDLRRTFATRVIERGDIAIAQRLLGHEDLNTTGIYDRRGEDAENDAVKDL